ncbi:MAG TPA: FIST N-terminal domain-containing protein [Kofleriaceae bacterium]
MAAELAAKLRGENLRLVVVFADWRLDPAILARAMQQALPAPVVGCTTIGVISANAPAPTAAALGLYGDWLRVGIGIANELPKSALARSRDAVHRAAAAIGTTADRLDSVRHVAFTLVDGSCGHEEAFCIASAATAPQIRMVGGSAATEHGAMNRRAYVWANGEALADAGVVVLLDSKLPFEAVTSSHLVSTPMKTVVTAASGRTIDELDGRPAAERLRELVGQLGDESKPSEYCFARFIDGMPFVRSMTQIDGNRIHLACAVEVGHVLRVMKPGDLIGQTARDLAAARERLGGELLALLAFSCIGRHWDAAARGLEDKLAETYASYPTIGFQSFGEQTGMLLVNHTLTALAIGARA